MLRAATGFQHREFPTRVGGHRGVRMGRGEGVLNGVGVDQWEITEGFRRLTITVGNKLTTFNI